MIVELAGFRDAELVRGLARRLEEVAAGRAVRIMHVCGTHEHAVRRYALRSLLPDGLEVIGGPGCPVCVCPAADIAQAMELARRGVVLATFGDMVRVPAHGGSLATARRQGGDVRVVGSISDAVMLARENPDLDVVFFAVGFETSACTFAATALAGAPANFSMLTSVRLVPPAMALLHGLDEVTLDGYLLPGHVCTVIGLEPFRPFVDQGVPLAVAGFEPVDVLQGLLQLVEQVQSGSAECGNAYQRMVRVGGNPVAIDAMERVFEPVDAVWRGIGVIPASGYGLRPEFEQLDARRRFDLEPAVDEDSTMPDGCACGQVLTGQIHPEACPLYGSACTPAQPHGPCMVSFEGSCRIAYSFDDSRG